MSIKQEMFNTPSSRSIRIRDSCKASLVAGVCCFPLLLLLARDPPALSPLASLLAWYVLLGVLSRGWRSWGIAVSNFCAPIILSFAMAQMNPYITGVMIVAWYSWLSHQSDHPQSWVARQVGAALLLCMLMDLTLLQQGAVSTIREQFAHLASASLRNAHGSGSVFGAEGFAYRELLFSVLLTVPLAQGGCQVGWRCLVLPACQVALSIFLILAMYGKPHFVALLAYFACGIGCLFLGTITTMSSIRPSHVRPQVFQCSCVALLAFGILCGVSNMVLAEKAGDAKSILFINDCREVEEGEGDMTYFSALPTAGSLVSFDKHRRQPRYDSLASKLLPALGYEVSIKSRASISRDSLGKYDAIVLICLQNQLTEAVKASLLDAVATGTSVLIAGDHTDIRGVQRPFNDIMEPLGIRLNYDSAYPFGQWSPHMSFCYHPINYGLSLQQYRGKADIGYSVGASLALDWKQAYPFIKAHDGFADEGTPNAPYYAGLGDQRYNENEIRGGLMLAAERTYGNGVFLAFGDTAFLQNPSIVHNYGYLDALFRYLTCPRVRSVHELRGWTQWLAVAGLTLSSAWFFSLRRTILALVLIVVSHETVGAQIPKMDTLSFLADDSVVIDDLHAEGYERHNPDRSLNVLTNLLADSTDCIALEGNALHAIEFKHPRAVLLLAPRGGLAREEEASLLQYVRRGGHLILSAGYFDARTQATWLEKIGCRVIPLVLGAGQGVRLEDESYGAAPPFSEAWAVEASDDWEIIVTCFEKPVVVRRTLGKGRVFIIADSYAFFDNTLSIDNSNTYEDAYRFYIHFLKESCHRRPQDYERPNPTR